MRQISAIQDPAACECETRSIRISGHSTSIRLERAFWAVLDEIAAAEGMTLVQLISQMHAEVTEQQARVRNFTSILRCACLAHLTGGEAHRIAAE